MLNEDYRDILRALHAERVRFLVVGAYAMAAHGYPRATMDIDIWVMPSAANANAALKALERFGAPLGDLVQEDLLKEDTVFQIGVAPRRIDIITGASGLRFEEAFSRSIQADLDGIVFRVLSLDDLIANKKAAGRAKDLVDVETLETLKQPRPEHTR
jgi:hypothetical protein